MLPKGENVISATKPPTQRNDDIEPEDPLNIANLLSLFERGLRPQSRFNIETANRAAQVDVGGQLLITMPRSGKDLLEIAYVGGRFRLLLE